MSLTPYGVPFKKSSSSPSEVAGTYSIRPTKPNPLLHGRRGSDEKETRRKLFLKRVREDSEDQKWKARGGDDEMMRTIWLAEERRRVARQAMEARDLPDLGEEEEEEDQAEEGADPSLDQIMADEVALEEQKELEALLAMVNTPNREGARAAQDTIEAPTEAMNISSRQTDQRPISDELLAAAQTQSYADTSYGSDDEEYDHIFLDVILQERRMRNQIHFPQQEADHDMMDTT